MPITSNSNTPVLTSAGSPDTLPMRGYTTDQLKEYILRQLGQPVWNVEVTHQQVLDAIQDALMLYSEWVPIRRPQTFQLVRGRFSYLEGVDVGQGIAQVDFVEPVPAPTEIFYGNLINPAPLFRTGLDEYDIFLRWRKTWKRVTSIEPEWFYDDYEKALYIYNPIERYQAGVITYWNFTDTRLLSQTGARWVKEYALSKARFIQGDLWSKFSGAIPAPAKDIQLDATRRSSAEAELEKLRNELKGMQVSAGISID